MKDTPDPGPTFPIALPIQLAVNGKRHQLDLDPRASVLDTLRDRLGVMSVKKGCDHGQCGACTVLADGKRVLSCLCLAASYDGADILTAEGLGTVDQLHPMQQAFLDHDGFQCGYCTPGQICSAVGMLDELAQGMPSHVTPDVRKVAELNDAEIRERMSGNLCRCGAYVNIVSAIREVGQGQAASAALPMPVAREVTR
ncbi:aldehyde dehydrogenase iron-sulfur subunit [Deinococcus piscis]|uniref:Aldehyde dehydrogenase iron-sulfur subunit n=1 Tax=Deinococcus piscis TaxID=394230 RepID=A0ABQ3KAB2_9DEIO|nr:2Fe-2S iron-sulfur cluster-binding protein [Deinococcus piscis]GHG10084.1 aldehyde dehydrogenase iron-sulfur subunit [Deinococcus piscis]